MSQTEAPHSSSPRKTPLYDFHLEAGGKVVDFAGWYLPVRFQGITEEHSTVRNQCGIFDVSHMGELWVTGSEAEKFLQYCACNDLSRIGDGQAQYTALLNREGGVVDDIIIYRFSGERFFLCVNAANTEKDFLWLKDLSTDFDVEVRNVSDEFGQIAVQGPQALSVASKILQNDVAGKPFTFEELQWNGSHLILARTGYTGEDGVEVFASPEGTIALWKAFLEAGVAPIGLGARDSLRLEACYPLHGHELREDVPALHSGLGWIVKFQKGDFLGSSALMQEKEAGPSRRLVGFFVEESGIVREESEIVNEQDEVIGWVTSGTKTPTVNKALGLAIVNADSTKVGQEFFAVVRGKKKKCRIVSTPFYRRGD